MNVDLAGDGDGQDDGDDAWLESAALGPDDVDEDALAEAMADAELGDLTPDEIAQFEAGLDTGDQTHVDQGEQPR
jgi:hypothetical protein